MQDKLKELENKYDVDWQKYVVSEFFDVKISRSEDKGNLDFVSSGYQFIGRTVQNNGIQGFINKLDYEPNPQNIFSVNQIGTINAQFRESEWYASQNIFVLTPVNYSNQLVKNFKFILAVLNKGLSIFDGGYSSYPIQKTLEDLSIQLPITNGQIAFDYIEEFVQTLESERLSTLEAYLQVTGLKDTKLTIAERKTLEALGTTGGERIEWREFNLESLFSISTPKKKFNANILNFNGSFPYVARGESNNGIRGYINEEEEFLNDGNTISFGQDTATMFYQKEPYFTGDKIKVLTAINPEKFDKFSALFEIVSMRKGFSHFSWGSSSYSVKVLNATKIQLPVKFNQTIDYDFMTNLIKATQKLVIKDVVDWLDNQILTTKQFIS